MFEAAKENDNIRPSKKKPIFQVNNRLRSYLKRYGREVKLPAAYKDLLRFTYSLPLKDKNGKPTLC